MLAEINWNPSNNDLRKFGWTLLIGFGLIGGVVFWKASKDVAFWIWGISAGVSALALTLPYLSKPFYWAWMGVAFVMGTIISTLILLIIFYGIFTPIGLAMRLFGRDSLKLKKSSFTQDTFWNDHPKITKESYERLF